MLSVQEAASTLSDSAKEELRQATQVIDDAIREDDSLDKIVITMHLSPKVEREIFRKYQDGGWLVSRWGSGSSDSGYTFAYPKAES